LLWKSPTSVIAIALLIVGASVLTLKSCGPDSTIKKYDQAIAAWELRADSAVKHDKAETKYADSVAKVNDSLMVLRHQDSVAIVKYQKRSNALSSTVAKLKVKDDSILARLDTTLNIECKPAEDLARSFSQLVDSLQISHQQDSLALVASANQARIDSTIISDLTLLNVKLKAQNDSILKVVSSVPVYKQEKFLGLFPLPSRTATGVAGIIIGIAASIAVIHIVH